MHEVTVTPCISCSCSHNGVVTVADLGRRRRTGVGGFQ